MRTIPVHEILEYLTANEIPFQYIGNDDAVIHGFSSITHYQHGTMTWIRTSEKLKDLPEPETVALMIVQQGIKTAVPNQIITAESKRAFFSIIENMIEPTLEPHSSIGENCYIAPTVTLGKNVVIGNGCVLDGDISIGNNTNIGHHVVIANHVNIGNNCTIQSGCVIGMDGYAFSEDNRGIKTMIRHYGGVYIGDRVWIGSLAHIARGTIDNTCIGDGCKIDALCHIAHNVIMEENCALVAGSIIMGSAHLKSGVYVASAEIRDQVVIDLNAFVGMGAIVTKNIPDYVTVAGVPAKIMKECN